MTAIFESLIRAHPAAILGAPRATARDLEERLAEMPAHLRDDLGLPPLPQQEPEPPALAQALRRASRWG